MLQHVVQHRLSVAGCNRHTKQHLIVAGCQNIGLTFNINLIHYKVKILNFEITSSIGYYGLLYI